MNKTNLRSRTYWVLAGQLVFLLFVGPVSAEPPANPEGRPLDPVIQWAEDALTKANKIKDYTALLTKRERIKGQLQEYQYMQLKIRHEPFSVYIKFLKPSSIKGREVIYVEGRNDGMLLAHDASGLGGHVGAVSLPPKGLIAMHGQRYPVTMIGFKNLGLTLIEQAKRDRQIMAPTDVKWFKGAKVDGQLALCIEVSHLVRHPKQTFATARVYIDEKLGIPIRYEGYMWPEKPGGDRVLVEEYTYSSIQLNVGLTDQDFDQNNPQYTFNSK